MNKLVIIVTSPDNGQTDGVTTFCKILSDILASDFHIDVQITKGVPNNLKELYSSDRLPIVFHNYWPAMFDIRNIKAQLPNATIVQIVHDLPWLTIFNGKPDAFFEAFSYCGFFVTFSVDCCI